MKLFLFIQVVFFSSLLLSQADYNFAVKLFNEKKYESAIPIFEQCLAEENKKESPSNNAKYFCLGYLVKSNEALNLNNKVIYYYNDLILLHKQLYGSENQAYITMLSNLGYAYILTNQFENAIPIYEKCLHAELQKSNFNRQDVELYFDNIVNCFEKTNNLIDAIGFLELSIPIKEEIYGKSDINYIVSNCNLARLYFESNEFDKALALSLNIDQLLNNSSQELKKIKATNSSFISFCYQKLSNYEKALEYAFRTSEFYSEIKKENLNDYVLSLDLLSGCFESNSKIFEAIEYSNLSLSIKKENIEIFKEEYVGSLDMLAKLNTRLKKFYIAENYLLESLQIRRENNFTTINSSNLLAIVYKETNRLDEALQILTTSKEQLKKAPNLSADYMIVINNLAVMYSEIGDYENALKLYQECYKIRKELFVNQKIEVVDYVISLYNLCMTNIRLNNNAIVNQQISEILDLGEKFNLKVNRDYLKMLHDISLYQVTIKKFDFVDSMLFEINDLLLTKNKLQIFGLTEIDLINLKSENYSSLVFENNYIFKQNPSTEKHIRSLNSLLNYKSLSLNIQREIQKELKIKNDDRLTNQFEEWKNQKCQLARLYELSPNELKSNGINLEEKENEANLIEQQLSKQLKSFASKDRLYRWEEIQEKLNEDEVFVEMLRLPVFDFEKMRQTDSITYIAYIIKKGSSQPEIVELPNGLELENDAFSEYYTNTTNKSKDNASQDEVSYSVYWEKINEAISGKKKIFISLDGVYNKINLNTLYNPREKKYLIETIEINYVTNTIEFINKPTKHSLITPNFKNAVLIGNPNFNQLASEQTRNELFFNSSRDIPNFLMDSLTRGLVVKNLPQTKIEIENIAKILEKSKIQVVSYLENDAREEKIKEIESPSILHIATHGYFFEDDLKPDFEENKFFGMEQKQFKMNPMLRSGLLLTGANKSLKSNSGSNVENGILTSLEASYLNLENTELVVLSACETGLGKIQNGVGVHGLRKGIKDAGAKNIIMSLWKVDDKVTQEFMSSFYEFYLSGLTIREAFSKTQILIKTKYPQPYYWGAFILVGE
jgi:CHAT domain-containing protein